MGSALTHKQCVELPLDGAVHLLAAESGVLHWKGLGEEQGRVSAHLRVGRLRGQDVSTQVHYHASTIPHKHFITQVHYHANTLACKYITTQEH